MIDPNEAVCKISNSYIVWKYSISSKSLLYHLRKLRRGRSTHPQTRKVNGDILQKKSQEHNWAMAVRKVHAPNPWSINSYAISKVLFKCNCLELCVLDIISITSKGKAWLLADQLEKPEDFINYRPTSHGGLGLHHIKFKAQAMLIHSFLETAVKPQISPQPLPHILVQIPCPATQRPP